MLKARENRWDKVDRLAAALLRTKAFRFRSLLFSAHHGVLPLVYMLLVVSYNNILRNHLFVSFPLTLLYRKVRSAESLKGKGEIVNDMKIFMMLRQFPLVVQD